MVRTVTSMLHNRTSPTSEWHHSGHVHLLYTVSGLIFRHRNTQTSTSWVWGLKQSDSIIATLSRPQRVGPHNYTLNRRTCDWLMCCMEFSHFMTFKAFISSEGTSEHVHTLPRVMLSPLYSVDTVWQRILNIWESTPVIWGDKVWEL